MSKETVPVTPKAKKGTFAGLEEEKATENSGDDKSFHDSLQDTVKTIPDRAFTENDFKFITMLLHLQDDKDIQKDLKSFFKTVGIDSWPFLYGVEAGELVKLANFPASSKLSLPVYQQCLTKIMDYASVTGKPLAPPVTFDLISEKSRESHQGFSPSSSSSTDGGHRMNLKTEIPKLPTFSGLDTHYISWKRKVMYTLGRAAMRKAVEQANFHLKYPEISEAVFDAIAAALYDGNSHSVAADQEAKDDRSAYNLFTALETTHNTSATRTNYVVSAIRELVALKLDHSTTVESFIEEFKSILTDMKQNGVDVDANYAMICGLLVYSIQSTEFDNEANYILENPGKPIQDYLDKLRLRTLHTRIKNGESAKADSDEPHSTVRRGGTSSITKKDGDKKKTRFDEETTKKVWCIPQFPSSWSKMMQNGAFQLMLEWRKMANGASISQGKLFHLFDVRSIKEENKSCDRDRDNKRKRNRHTKKEPAKVEDADGSSDEDTTKPPAKCRIVLNNPRFDRRGKVVPGSANRTVTTIPAGEV